jgi:hypothetical protein
LSDPIVDKLTEDMQPKAAPEGAPVANPAVDRLFRSWGGKPERVDNWQAIALSFLEIAIFAVSPRAGKAEE